jgi:hypothetical protein
MRTPTVGWTEISTQAAAILMTTVTLALDGCRAGPDYHAPSLPQGAETPLLSVNPK